MLLIGCAHDPPPVVPQPIAQSDGKLRMVAEGECARLRASALENALFVHANGVIGRWNGSAIVDTQTLSRGAESIEPSWIEGSFPNNAWLLYRENNRADHALRWTSDHWELVWGPPKTEPLARFNRTPNGAIGATYERRIRQEGNRIIVSHPTEVGIPAPLDVGEHAGKEIFDVAVRPNGETFVLLVGDDAKPEIRRSPAMSPEPLPITGYGKIFLTSKAAYVSSDQGTAMFDGARWVVVKDLPTYASAIEDDWILAGGKLYRGAVDSSPPGDLVRFAAPWAITSEGLYRWSSDGWSSVELPKRYVARYVVRNGDEVWVEAAENRMSALFKTGPIPPKIYDCSLR